MWPRRRRLPTACGSIASVRGGRSRGQLEVKRSRVRADTGQASLEFVTVLPIVIAITLTLAGSLAGYGAREAADQAAVAAAIAHLQGGDAKNAANDASPGWGKADVVVRRGEVTVTVAPRLPRFAAAVIDAERTVVFDAEAKR